MPIRQKWTQIEDKALRKIINKTENPEKTPTLKWDVVAAQLTKFDFHKSAKQCRERLLHQMDPATDSKRVS